MNKVIKILLFEKKRKFIETRSFRAAMTQNKRSQLSLLQFHGAKSFNQLSISSNLIYEHILNERKSTRLDGSVGANE
jgi:hypothetical protein